MCRQCLFIGKLDSPDFILDSLKRPSVLDIKQKPTSAFRELAAGVSRITVRQVA